jgi:hypothetical protein
VLGRAGGHRPLFVFHCGSLLSGKKAIRFDTNFNIIAQNTGVVQEILLCTMGPESCRIQNGGNPGFPPGLPFSLCVDIGLSTRSFVDLTEIRIKLGTTGV